MIGLRQNLAGCGLACLLLAVMATPAAAEADAGPPAPPTLLELLAMWLGGSDPSKGEETPDPPDQPEPRSKEPEVSDASEGRETRDSRYRPRSWGMQAGVSERLGLWSIWPGESRWLSRLRLGGFGPSTRPRGDANEDFRPGRHRRGKVTSDFGSKPPGLGVADSVHRDRAGRIKIKIKDLLRNDLGWKCDPPCKVARTNRLDLEAFAGGDNVERIVRKGNFIYVEAAARRKESTFTYQVFDKDTEARAEVQVNVWFGNRQPKARKDRLKAFADVETAFDVADLLGNDRDRDGDLLDLVRVWCPKDGRVSMREVDGELKVFFQPDTGFTGSTYFKYTIADLSDPEHGLVAGPGALAPERKTFAEGLVRVRVLASPS